MTKVLKDIYKRNFGNNSDKYNVHLTVLFERNVLIRIGGHAYNHKYRRMQCHS